MRIRWLTIAALVLLVSPAVSQDSWTTRATATVPFDFVANGVTLPAGEYRIMTYSAGNSLMIQNTKTPDDKTFLQNRNILLNPGNFQKQTKLIFFFNEGQHVLHQIGLVDDNHLHDIIHGDDVVELVATR